MSGMIASFKEQITKVEDAILNHAKLRERAETSGNTELSRDIKKNLFAMIDFSSQVNRLIYTFEKISSIFPSNIYDLTGDELLEAKNLYSNVESFLERAKVKEKEIFKQLNAEN